MTERPILFSGPMVRAILAGKKTQTRRVIKPQPPCQPEVGMYAPIGIDRHGEMYPKPEIFGAWCDDWGAKCPYGQPGDVLWVKETFVLESNVNIDSNDRYPPPFSDGRPTNWVEDDHWGNYWEQPHYKATDPRPDLGSFFDDDGNEKATGWRSPLFMPRWASRITLEITDVRVERLNQMTNADAVAEGEIGHHDTGLAPIERYTELWDHLNAKRGFSWQSNPWVWVLEFRGV